MLNLSKPRAFLICIGMMTLSSAAMGQDAVPIPKEATRGTTVPTIKFLGIGTFKPTARPEVWKPMLPSEARTAIGMYLAGKVDQWYVKQDNTGIVFVLNATNMDDARKIVDQLPLVSSGQMQFELVGLGPLSPLGTLLPQLTK